MKSFQHKTNLPIRLGIIFIITVLSLYLSASMLRAEEITKLDPNSWRPSNNIMGIHIGSSVSEITYNAFVNQIELKYILVSDDNPYFASYSNCLYDKELTALICFPQALKTAEIPSSVTSIRRYALYGVEPEIADQVINAIRGNAERLGVPFSTYEQKSKREDFEWPYTGEYPLTG